jgi:hypothetical protein
MVADADAVYVIRERAKMLLRPFQGRIHNVLPAPQSGMQHIGGEPPIPRQNQVEYVTP